MHAWDLTKNIIRDKALKMSNSLQIQDLVLMNFSKNKVDHCIIDYCCSKKDFVFDP